MGFFSDHYMKLHVTCGYRFKIVLLSVVLLSEDGEEGVKTTASSAVTRVNVF
jgi:hypothetical protein